MGFLGFSCGYGSKPQHEPFIKEETIWSTEEENRRLKVYRTMFATTWNAFLITFGTTSLEIVSLEILYVPGQLTRKATSLAHLSLSQAGWTTKRSPSSGISRTREHPPCLDRHTNRSATHGGSLTTFQPWIYGSQSRARL